MTSPYVPFAAAAFALLASALPAQAHHAELTNGRITMILADDSAGLNRSTRDRVDSLIWVDSTGTPSPNLVAPGGPIQCGDPSEFFGQAYGETDSTEMHMVWQGSTGTWTEDANGMSATSVTKGKSNCTPLSGTTTTLYNLSTGAKHINAVKITRTFVFNKHAESVSADLRAYAPRLPLATYSKVLAPDVSGVVQTYDPHTCPVGCPIANWSNAWFADEDANGRGMLVIRDKSSTAPA
ncbi:MAG TPA: hypothetical protein VHL34_04295, partial [Rhizomicrobium sp.]|nr:hypothetical protein [Rhizomicrobium sp.]